MPKRWNFHEDDKTAQRLCLHSLAGQSDKVTNETRYYKDIYKGLPKLKPSPSRVLRKHLRLRLVFPRGKANVVLDVKHSTLRIAISRDEIQEQVVFHSENSICLEKRVVSGVKLCSDTKVVVVRDHHMNMRRTLGVAAHHPQHLGRRPGSVNRVLRRLEAVEVEATRGVGAEFATEVVLGLVLGVVGIVLAVCAGLPHVEDGIGDACAGVDVLDGAVEVGELAVFGHIQDDAGAEITERGIRRPERAKDRGRSWGIASVGSDSVVDLVDQPIALSVDELSFAKIAHSSVRLTTQRPGCHRASKFHSCSSGMIGPKS
jgi:hypothetical protein